MTDPVCDPEAGWGGIGHIWEHWSIGETRIRAHLVAVTSSSQAHLIVFPSWAGYEQIYIPSGEHIDFQEDGRRWEIHCDGIVSSMKQADIRICSIEEEAPDPNAINVGDTVTVDGHTFTLLSLVCGTNARIVARIDGVLQSSRLKAVAAGVLITSFPTIGMAVGGLYVAVKTIGGVCDLTLDSISGGGLTPQDQTDNDNRAQDEYIDPGGNKATPEEITAADKEAEERTANWLNADYVEKVRQLTAGEITKREFNSWLKETTYQLKLVILDEKYYIKNFSLNIPSIVIAGDVDITGTAPQPNQTVKIVVVKKLFGFDWAAADQEIASPQSDSNYEYYDTISLNEFGMIEVYGLIGKDWWSFLDKDITTEKHTVLVLTPMILLALLAILAMVLDKKYNFVGIFKKKRGKK